MKRLLILALLLSACGGSPSGPSTVVPSSAPVASVARDGITGQEVSASVQNSGGMSTVNAPGYLPRSQPSAPVLWLWPQDQEYVASLVYWRTGGSTGYSLRRWNGPVRVAWSSDLSQYDAQLAAAAAEISRAAKINVQALPAGSQANVTLRIDRIVSNAGFVAATEVRTAGATITSADVMFLHEGYISGNLLHELGHAIGLGHSPNQVEVMWATTDRRNASTFSDQEARALTMMYSWRKAGNTYPDNEPQGLQSTRREVVTISCR